MAYTPDLKAKGLDVVVRRAGRPPAVRRRAARGLRGRARAGAARTCSRTRRAWPPSASSFRGKAPPEQFRARAAPRARLRRRRALGGLRPGAARGARGRRAARHRPLRRPVRGAAPGARAGASSWWPTRSTRRALAPRDPSGVRAAGASARAPTASAPPGCCDRFRPEAVAAHGRPREVRARPCSASRRGHSQDGSLERLRVGLERVALRDRPAAGRQPLAQPRLAHQAAAARGDLRRGRPGRPAARSRRPRRRRPPRPRAPSRSAAARPPRPRAAVTPNGS